MPTNDQGGLTASIVAGDSLIVQESVDKPEVGGETPAQNNEELKTQIVETAEEAVTSQKEVNETKTTFDSGTKKARQLGERQRSLAKALLTTAREGDQSIKDSIKSKIDSDPLLQKYYQDKWAKDYDEIFSESGLELSSEISREQPTAEEVKEKATIEAR